VSAERDDAENRDNAQYAQTSTGLELREIAAKLARS